ncbi:MAG: hypothetical protein ACRD28_00430 [Acidobacteriaceae bacterium]
MNHRKFINRIGTGAAVLGMALCLPAAMLAQDQTPPPQDSQGMAGQQANPGEHSMSHHRRHSANGELKHLTKTLNLTEDQQQQMKPILQERQEKMKSIRNDSSLSAEQRRQQMRDAWQDSQQKLEAVMTDTQKQQYEQQMQQRRSHMRNRNGQGMGTGNAGTPPPPPQQ